MLYCAVKYIYQIVLIKVIQNRLQFIITFKNTKKIQKKMIEYYRIPTKTKQISTKQILTLTEQYQLKDAIYNKSISSIKILNIKNSNINDSTIGLLWTIPDQLPIIHINLSQNFSFITDQAIGHLCQCSNIRQLKQLNLADNCITNQGLRRLSKANNMGKLEELILYGNSDIGSEGVIYLGESQYIRNLRKIDLHDTSVCDKGLNFFLRTQNSAHLEVLDISMNSKKVTDHTFKAIASSKYCTSLKQIKAQDCLITDQGIAALADSQNLSKLEVLSVNNSMNKKNNIITDHSLEAIAYSKSIKKLKNLQLRNTDVTSKGLNILSVCLGSQNLQILRLSYCVGVRDDAKRYLESIIQYRNLQKLYINSTNISKQVAEGMAEKYPNLGVIF